MKSILLVLRLLCRTVIGHASVVDDGPDESLVDDKQDASGHSPSRFSDRAHVVQQDFASTDNVVNVYCPCEALVEDDAEELHRLLEKLDRDVIDLQDDVICRDVFASREEDFNCLVDRDLEAPFFEEFCRHRWVPLDVSGQG